MDIADTVTELQFLTRARSIQRAVEHDPAAARSALIGLYGGAR